MNEYLKNRILKHEQYIAALERKQELAAGDPERHNQLTMEILIVRIQMAETAIIQNQFINQNRAQP